MSIAQSSDLVFRFLGGAPAAHFLLKEKIMQSTIQIFKLDEVKKGTSKKTGNPYEIHTAQAALIDEHGAVDMPNSSTGMGMTNPSTGLPMIGSVDSGGNAFGAGRRHY